MDCLRFQSLIGILLFCKPLLKHFPACKLGLEGVSLQEQHEKFQSLVGILSLRALRVMLVLAHYNLTSDTS